MYPSKNDKHWLINSCEQQNIRTNLYDEARIPYMQDAICMILYKIFSIFFHGIHEFSDPPPEQYFYISLALGLVKFKSTSTTEFLTSPIKIY